MSAWGPISRPASSSSSRRWPTLLQGIPLKAFGNWRAKFKAEPQLQARKLLYRRRGLTTAPDHRAE